MDKFVWGDDRVEADGDKSTACSPLRVYFGPRTDPALLSEPSFLQVPTTDKNFLISPPGSPPVGWEQIVEDPPNAAPLAQDLMQALRYLTVGHEDFSMSVGGEEDATNSGTPKEVVLIDTGADSNVPSLKIFSPPDGAGSGSSARQQKISLVKATIESMGGTMDDTPSLSVFPPGDPLEEEDMAGAAPKIKPTARPPL
ncbi:hypothetical protein BT69DRAFT_1279221 [Atractiella rhizophila]|nr:hypothetical protein BT69DRAFT_1279221 [Atractiella rhizophila]